MANCRVDKTIYYSVYWICEGYFCAGVLLINISYEKEQNIIFLAKRQQLYTMNHVVSGNKLKNSNVP